MKLLFQRFWALSWLLKLAIIGGVLILLLLLTSWGRDKIFNIRSWFFDREQAAATEREKKLAKTSEEAIKAAQKWEAIGTEAIRQGAEKDAKIAALENLIEAKGGQILSEQKRLENELAKIKADQGSCSQSVNPDEHYKCVCAKLARAGLPCAG